MNAKILAAYEASKEIDMQECGKHIEKLKNKNDELELRIAIRETETRKSELEGMLILMRVADVISEKRYRKERNELNELFSPKQLYGATMLRYDGTLLRNLSEVKKED